MGKKCSVPNCKSGYYESGKSKNISFHSFPLDPDLQNRWEKIIWKSDHQAKPYSSVCSLHFTEKDYQIERRDKQHRRVKAVGSKLQAKILQPDAVPSVFFDLTTTDVAKESMTEKEAKVTLASKC